MTDSGEQPDLPAPRPRTDLDALSEALRETTSELEALARPGARVDPADIVRQVRGVAQVVQEYISFRGPLPTPDMMRAYDLAIPGLGDKLVQMAIEERDHRFAMDEHQMQMEREAMRMRREAISIDRDHLGIRARGQMIGAWLAGGIIVLGAALGFAGHTAVAIAFIGTGAASVAGVFVARQRQIARAERDDDEDQEQGD